MSEQKVIPKQEINKPMYIGLKPLERIWQLDLKTGEITVYKTIIDHNSGKHILRPQPSTLYCVTKTPQQARFKFQEMIKKYNENIQKKKADESESLHEDYSQHSNTSAPDQQPEESPAEDSPAI